MATFLSKRLHLAENKIYRDFDNREVTKINVNATLLGCHYAVSESVEYKRSVLKSWVENGKKLLSLK